MAKPGNRKWLGVGLKAAVSVGLLALIARQVDLAALAAELAALSPGLWVFGVALLLGLTLLQGWRWWYTLRLLNVDLPCRWTMRATLMSLLFNQALPGTVGGDAYRIVGATRQGTGLRGAVSGVIIDRVTGVLGLVAIALAGLLPFAALDEAGLLTVGLMAVEAGILGAVVVLLALHRLPVGNLPRPLRGLLQMSADAWTVARRPGPAAVLVGTSVLNHLLFTLMFFAIARAMDLDIGLGAFLVLAPPMLLVALIPVSIAGWGVREGAAVAGFGLIGVAPEAALSLSVALGLVLLLSGLCAGALAEGWGWLDRPGRDVLSRRSKGP